jgi:hypothetical protein
LLAAPVPAAVAFSARMVMAVPLVLKEAACVDEE